MLTSSSGRREIMAGELSLKQLSQQPDLAERTILSDYRMNIYHIHMHMHL